MADLNGDGIPDIVVVNCYCGRVTGVGTLGVLLGNGDGTFRNAVVYNSGGYQSQSVAIGDVNGDGHPDLVVANTCQSEQSCVSGGTGTVTVLLANGDGTFQPEVTFGSGGFSAYSVAIADSNGDRHPDLVVSNHCAESSCTNGSIGVLLGNGDGTFNPAVTYASGGYAAYSLAVGDLNGDGHTDVVVANECNVSPACENGIVAISRKRRWHFSGTANVQLGWRGRIFGGTGRPGRERQT